MGWLTGSKNTPIEQGGTERKANGLFAFFGGNLPDPQYPAPTFLDHYGQGYAKNDLVYACITEKATSAPEAPLRVYGKDGLGDPEENHPLRKLIATPNPLLTEFELFELLYIHLDLAGNAFWWIVRDRGGRPVELWPLRPDLVRLRVAMFKGVAQQVIGYDYVVEGDTVPLGRDVVHFKLPNPADWLVGMAPMRPALRAVALDNQATDFVKSLLQNSAIPGTVIKAQQAVDEIVANRIKAKWKDTFGGGNRGDVAVLQAGMDVQTLGLDPAGMEFPDLRTISESRICMAFGVPPILVGAKIGLDRSTFANYGEARRSFWEETLMPLQRRVSDRIIKDLLPLVSRGDQRNRVIKFDRSGVLALQESEQARWERATNALRAGGITIEDFRRILGLPAVDGADVFLRPAGVIHTTADGTPTGGSQDLQNPPAVPQDEQNTPDE